jgi:hypothetical protein
VIVQKAIIDVATGLLNRTFTGPDSMLDIQLQEGEAFVDEIPSEVSEGNWYWIDNQWVDVPESA